MEWVEFKIAIRPGRYDTHGLREFVEGVMMRLASTIECGIEADFGNVKLAAGKSELCPTVPSNSLRCSQNRVLVFDERNDKYVYEGCDLTIRAGVHDKVIVAHFLEELRERIMAGGGRFIEE